MATILIVDDNADNVYLLRSLLQGNGYSVQTAENGKKALETARETPPDIVISDILMPGMDGFALCHEWKADPGLAAIPFVFLTATYTDPRDEQLALKQGADLFLTKPIELQHVLEAVKSLLNRPSGGNAFAAGATQPESSYLKEYNEVLVRKLESKVEELKTKNLELARKEEMKSRFLAVAAHELYTPMACVLGYSELLTQEFDRNLVPELCHSVERLLDVTHDIIRMSKAEVEELPKLKESIDLNALVSERVDSVRPFIAHRKQTVSLNLAREELGLTGDPEELGQAFLSLILNAIRFTPDGGRITVETSATEAEHLISVTDTGIGIPAEEHERIFMKFYQLEDVSKHHSGRTEFLSGGLGLGLSIARAIVEKYRGCVTVQSRVGEGSTFTIRLPKAGRL